MVKSRQQLEDEEERFLAPYAQKSSRSAGRKYKESRHPFRTDYQRDRSRIIHSRAFRRLEYKTQIFLSSTGDYLRTRLTHTIEVAALTRTIARTLGLNEDLAEAISLAHDLGHPPFGYSGELVLDGLMSEYGGFNHNAQSLRIVEELEERYPRFSGLNLSVEVLDGLKRHRDFHEIPSKLNSQHYNSTLEAQVANLADEITYYSHDLDDGLESNLITVEQLSKITLWKETESIVHRHFPKLRGRDMSGYIIRCIIDRQVQDVIDTSVHAISEANVQSVEEVRKQKQPLIRCSKELGQANRQLRKFLLEHLYHHPKVEEMNQRVTSMLKNVFGTYVQCPTLLGAEELKRSKKEGLHRVVCDYLAGMTDRDLLREHEKLFLQEGMIRAMRTGPPHGMRRVFE